MQLQFDPDEAVGHLATADPQLGELIRVAGPYTVQPDLDAGIFESLMRSIVYQQLSGKAAATIFGRLVALWPGQRFPTADQLLAADEQTLRSVGLSRNKAFAVQDLARHQRDGQLPTVEQAAALSDAELVEQITKVRGIGPWTVEMLMIFRLGRPDVLPVTDLGVRKGFRLTYGDAELPSIQRLVEHAEGWRPFRSVASWYMWRALEL